MTKFKRFLVILLIVVLSIVPILYGVIYWFGKDIKQYLVSQINTNLAVEVKTDDIQFSVFGNFPKASLLFSNVIIYENYPGRKNELLKAKELFLSFNIWDIIHKNYTINEIVILNGKADFYIDNKGRDNFTIVKPSSDKNTSNDSLKVNLENIRIEDMEVGYIDRELQLELNGNINKTNLKGNFYLENFALAWQGDFHFNSLTYSKINYLKNRQVSMDSELDVNLSKQTYLFKKGDIEISGIPLMANGQIELLPDDRGTRMNLEIKGKDMTIQSFLSLLPEENKAYIKDYESEGDFYFNTNINGTLNEAENPIIKVDFGIQKGRVFKSGISQGLEDLSCKGSFSNGTRKTAQTSALVMENFKARLGTNELSAFLKIEDLNDPLMQIKLNGNIDLEKLGEFLDLSVIETLKGFAFANINFTGKIKDLQNRERILNTKSEGDLKLSNIELQLENNPHTYKITNGLFKLSNNDFFVTDFTAEADDTRFTLNGTVRNFMPYLLLNNQTLDIDARLNSPFIDLEKVFFTQRNQDRMDSSGHIFPADITMNLQLVIDKFKMKLFNAGQINGDIQIKNNVLKTDNLKLQTMNGQIDFTGEMNNKVKDKILISFDANLKNIDINQLFYQCGNFGQEALTDKHIKGKLDTKIQFASIWSTDFVCDMNKVTALADITINNGELVEYEPMMALSKYADVNDLKHLKFDKLTNHIEISDQKISIPQMDIKNNALNITLSGTHRFDNFLDYRVRVKLSDVLRKKRNKPVDPEFEEEEEQGGGLYIYLIMKGFLGDLDISYDKIGVKKKIKESIQNEKKNIRDILKKEFENEEEKKLKEEEKKQEQEVNWEDDLPK